MITTDINILRKISRETSIEECESNGIFQVLEKELEESGKSGVAGVGLSAIQIGIDIRACIIRINYQRREPLKINMINPVIEKQETPIIFTNEGCLSFPNIYYSTQRYNEIVVQWIDYDKKENQKAYFHGLEAQVLEHEIDHMYGICFIDRKFLNIGRNEKCPSCLQEGIEIKYKKCKKHFVS